MKNDKIKATAAEKQDRIRKPRVNMGIKPQSGKPLIGHFSMVYFAHYIIVRSNDFLATMDISTLLPRRADKARLSV